MFCSSDLRTGLVLCCVRCVGVYDALTLFNWYVVGLRLDAMVFDEEVALFSCYPMTWVVRRMCCSSCTAHWVGLVLLATCWFCLPMIGRENRLVGVVELASGSGMPCCLTLWCLTKHPSLQPVSSLSWRLDALVFDEAVTLFLVSLP